MRHSLIFLLVASACSFEPSIQDTQQAQIDPQVKVWREFALVVSAPTPIELARIQVIGERAPAGYEDNTEYWFVNQEALSLLGRYSLDFSLSYQGEAIPPTPDYEQFQVFAQPVYPEGGWGDGWLRDPIRGGTLYTGPSYSMRFFSDANGISRVVWYQVIPSSHEAINQEPAGLYRLGQEMTVPEGFLGYSIAQDVF